MPRKKQFLIHDALTKAMHEFWRRGYHPTSMQNLVDCMGIGRGSIYDTFGSKHGLFMLTLDHYMKIYSARVGKMLAQSSSPMEAIMSIFESAIAALVVDGSSDGCFIINTAVELAAHDDEIAEVVSGVYRQTEHLFCTLIEQGQATGAIPRTVDTVPTSRILLSLFIGLRILTRSRADESLLRAIKKQAAALIT